MQPPFLPEAPLPHKSFSIIVILIEGFFSLIFNAVQRPVNPPPTTQTSTYNDLILTCTKVIDEIEELRELGAEYDNQSSTDDYHFFRIDETDKRKIKKLKRLGFIKYDIND